MVKPAIRVLCPENEVQALIALAKTDPPESLHALEVLLETYPADPRLHFLRGSWLAGGGDYAAARAAMRQAVDLAPDYAVARFQLGLLELTSGEPYAAQETWGPLHALPPDNYLRLFVVGLCHLIRDAFADALESLERGIAQNHENLPMNGDMRRMADEIRKALRDKEADGGAVSSVGLLLQQAALKTKH